MLAMSALVIGYATPAIADSRGNSRGRLPEPVAATRDKVLAAAQAGDLKRLATLADRR